MGIYYDMKNKINEEELKKVANGIKNGMVALLPTETVYGIGTNGLDAEAVEKIYKIKGRNLKNPINLLVSDIKMVETVAQDITDIEYQLMKTFFPGPFTLILKRKKIVPNIVTAGNETVGVRMPSHPIARKLVQYAGIPLSAPSANISGRPSGTNLEDILEDFAEQVDFVIDGGKSNFGLESTIVKVIDGTAHILRPGAITIDQIKKVTGSVIIEDAELPSNSLKHYQINSQAILVYSKNSSKMIDKITELSKNYKNPVILSCSENFNCYLNNPVIDIGSYQDLQTVSKNIFSNLRKAEKLNPDIILIEGFSKDGLGLAIMNRLLNVCNHHYIEL